MLETIVGAAVLLISIGFVILAYQGSDASTATSGYTLYAKFDKVDGLSIGSDVRVSGIKVGKVEGQELDSVTYLARVELLIDDDVKLPIDSSAEIVSDGLLGQKYISLVPGAEDAMFSEGNTIRYTQSAVNIESLIGKFMFGGNVDTSPDGAAAPEVKDPAADAGMGETETLLGL